MIIREANLNDASKIVEFNWNLAFETEDKRLSKNTLKKGVEALIQDQNKGVYYLCEINGEVVGQIMYTYEWSDWRNGTFIWIQSVYVHKEYRGKGVFKNLYSHIKNICDNDESICGIRLYVERENYTAQKTYKALGMEQCNYYMYEYTK